MTTRKPKKAAGSTIQPVSYEDISNKTRGQLAQHLETAHRRIETLLQDRDARVAEAAELRAEIRRLKRLCQTLREMVPCR